MTRFHFGGKQFSGEKHEKSYSSEIVIIFSK
jgi:hypothetical protein